MAGREETVWRAGRKQYGGQGGNGMAGREATAEDAPRRRPSFRHTKHNTTQHTHNKTHTAANNGTVRNAQTHTDTPSRSTHNGTPHKPTRSMHPQTSHPHPTRAPANQPPTSNSCAAHAPRRKEKEGVESARGRPVHTVADGSSRGRVRAAVCVDSKPQAVLHDTHWGRLRQACTTRRGPITTRTKDAGTQAQRHQGKQLQRAGIQAQRHQGKQLTVTKSWDTGTVTPRETANSYKELGYRHSDIKGNS